MGYRFFSFYSIYFTLPGLTGFVDAIHAAFPNTEVQMCIVHQLRNTFKYVPYKYRKALVKDLKPPSLEATEAALEDGAQLIP